MSNAVLRWFVLGILLMMALSVIGMIAYARGPEHHRGDDDLGRLWLHQDGNCAVRGRVPQRVRHEVEQHALDLVRSAERNTVAGRFQPDALCVRLRGKGVPHLRRTGSRGENAAIVLPPPNSFAPPESDAFAAEPADAMYALTASPFEWVTCSAGR